MKTLREVEETYAMAYLGSFVIAAAPLGFSISNIVRGDRNDDTLRVLGGISSLPFTVPMSAFTAPLGAITAAAITATGAIVLPVYYAKAKVFGERDTSRSEPIDETPIHMTDREIRYRRLLYKHPHFLFKPLYNKLTHARNKDLATERVSYVLNSRM